MLDNSLTARELSDGREGSRVSLVFVMAAMRAFSSRFLTRMASLISMSGNLAVRLFSVIQWHTHSNRRAETRCYACLDRSCDSLVNTHRVYCETPTDTIDARQKYYEYLTLLLARFDSLERTRKVNIDSYSLQILDCAKWLHNVTSERLSSRCGLFGRFD